MEEGQVTKINFEYAENPVRFSLRSCCTKKPYSMVHVERQAIPVLLNRLKHFEDEYTWKMLASEERGKGITPEKKNTPSYDAIDEQRQNEDGVFMGEENHYFHMRVKSRDKHWGLFRIFGYQKKDMFCITHFDVKGAFHH